MGPLCHKRCYNSPWRISKESHKLGFDHGSTVIAFPMLISRASPYVPWAWAVPVRKRVTTAPFPKEGSPVFSCLSGSLHESVHERVLVIHVLALQGGWAHSGSREPAGLLRWFSLRLSAILPGSLSMMLFPQTYFSSTSFDSNISSQSLSSPNLAVLVTPPKQSPVLWVDFSALMLLCFYIPGTEAAII